MCMSHTFIPQAPKLNVGRRDDEAAPSPQAEAIEGGESRIALLDRMIRLTYSHIGIYDAAMARAATTSDAFNAVAEPRRRQILDVLAGGERPVNDLVDVLGLGQPQVSKHLRVLREVGVVDVRNAGRQRLYRLNAQALKPIHDWLKTYERSWSERFDQLDVVLDDLKQKEEGDGSDE